MKMNINMNKIAVLVGLLTLAGCSSSPSSVDMAKNRLEAQELMNEAEQEKAEAVLSNIPDWVLEPPVSDRDGVYGVGVGESKKIDIAIKKAGLNAQFELAKAFGQELSGSEQSYTKDGTTGTTERYTQLIDSIVDSVPVGAYETISQKAVVVDGKYTVYKLTKLSYDNFETSLNRNNATSIDTEIKEAFSELQMRLEKRKEGGEKTNELINEADSELINESN